MENYSTKQDKLKSFILRLKNHKGNLSAFFREWANETGMAVGSVRNYYYTIAKKSNVDLEFCKKYLDGTPLKVNKIKPFCEKEKTFLMDRISLAKKDGKSVRSEILSLAKGNAKEALRLQNKYRNEIKNQNIKTEKVKISSTTEEKIKRGIDKLLSRLMQSVIDENRTLKEKIKSLESKPPIKKRSALDFLLGGDENAVN